MSGQGNRENIFLPTKLTISPSHNAILGWGTGGGGIYIKKQYKLFTLGTGSCFSELNIHRFNANTPPPPPPPSQMTCIMGRVKKANNDKYKLKK